MDCYYRANVIIIFQIILFQAFPSYMDLFIYCSLNQHIFYLPKVNLIYLHDRKEPTKSTLVETVHGFLEKGNH